MIEKLIEYYLIKLYFLIDTFYYYTNMYVHYIFEYFVTNTHFSRNLS